MGNFEDGLNTLYYDIVTSLQEPGSRMWQFDCNYPHNLTMSATIRWYDLIEVGVFLLEEMCHCGSSFETAYKIKVPTV